MIINKIFYVGLTIFLLSLCSSLFANVAEDKYQVTIRVENGCRTEKIFIGRQEHFACKCTGTCESSAKGESLPNAIISYPKNGTCKVLITAEKNEDFPAWITLGADPRPLYIVICRTDEARSGCGCTVLG